MVVLRGVRARSRCRIDDARVLIVMEEGESKGSVNQAGSEPFPGGAVVCRNAFSLVGGKAGMKLLWAWPDADGRCEIVRSVTYVRLG
jgi:hypothetical protein